MALGSFAKNLKRNCFYFLYRVVKIWRGQDVLHPKNRENSQATICDVVINFYHDTMLLLSKEIMTNALQMPGGRAMNDTSVKINLGSIQCIFMK